MWNTLEFSLVFSFETSIWAYLPDSEKYRSLLEQLKFSKHCWFNHRSRIVSVKIGLWSCPIFKQFGTLNLHPYFWTSRSISNPSMQKVPPPSLPCTKKSPSIPQGWEKIFFLGGKGWFSSTGKYRGLQGNPCYENRILAMRTGSPVMKTYFSLQELTYREFPVSFTGFGFAV